MSWLGADKRIVRYRRDSLRQRVVLPPNNRTRPMRSLMPARRCGPVVVDDA